MMTYIMCATMILVKRAAVLFVEVPFHQVEDRLAKASPHLIPAVFTTA